MNELSPKTFIKPLTGLRAFAAFGVVLFHFCKDSGLTVSVFAPAIQHGYMGVDLFFILSGFIVHHVYHEKFADVVGKTDYVDFIRNRFARIYPVHFVTFILMMVFFAISKQILHHVPKDDSSFSLLSILSSLVLMQAWFDIPSPNIPSWSVSAEWFAYLFYPFAAKCSSVYGTISRIMLVFLCLTITALAANLHPLLRISPEFILGMASYELSLRTYTKWSRFRFFGLMIIGTIIVCCYFLPEEHLEAFAGLFALLIISLSNKNDWLNLILTRPLVVYLGEISYSTYMVHAPVWAFVKNSVRLLNFPVASPIVIVSSIMIVIAVSSITFHYVELPARRALRATRRPIIEVQPSQVPTA